MIFIDDFYLNSPLYPTHTELMEGKSRMILEYAFNGYGKSFEDAMKIIQDADTLDWTEAQKSERRMLIDLVDNLVDFAVAGEHQALKEMAQDRAESESKEEFMEMALATFAKYNERYAEVENDDILYALGAAAAWNEFESEEIIEFRTQGDERVRASHAVLDGLRYRKSEFPDALVPPIDYACRCYLFNTGSTDGRTLTNRANVGALLLASANTVFKHNVATTGIMFSEDHPYFEIDSDDEPILAQTAKRIKRRLGVIV